MANGIRTSEPVDSIKDVVRTSVKFPEFDKTPDEGRWTYRPKRCGKNNENNSPKTLNVLFWSLNIRLSKMFWNILVNEAQFANSKCFYWDRADDELY